MVNDGGGSDEPIRRILMAEKLCLDKWVHPNTGLRSLLVEGARSAIRSAETTHSGKMKDGKLRSWVLEIKKRKESPNKVAVALANKMVRMAFAIWKNGTSWHPAA